MAIALGVALGYAVQLINAAAVNELAQGVKTLSGDADLEVRGPRGGFAEAIYPTIARMEDVAVASPVVEVDAKIAGREASLKIVGVDVFRAGYLQPGLIPNSADRLDTLRPDALFLSPAAARSLGIAVGDTVHVQVALADVALRVAGELGSAGNQRFGLMDIAGAQAAFDRLGSFSRIDLRLRRASMRRRSARRCAECCRRASKCCVPRPRLRQGRACRARIASISTCSRSSHCLPAGCSCSRRRRTRWCAGARSSRCCACSASRAGASR